MKKILIIDDDRNLQKTISGILRKEGYNVISAVDGMQGVMFAHRNSPDLVILDYSMPAGDGLSVAHKIKLSVKTQDTPIVVYSGRHIEELREELLPEGITEFVQKPDMEELLKKINAFLKE